MRHRTRPSSDRTLARSSLHPTGTSAYSDSSTICQYVPRPAYPARSACSLCRSSLRTRGTRASTSNRTHQSAGQTSNLDLKINPANPGAEGNLSFVRALDLPIARHRGLSLSVRGASEPYGGSHEWYRRHRDIAAGTGATNTYNTSDARHHENREKQMKL